MKFGISLLSIVPCRKEPANVSEMVSQLLFGDTYEVLEDTEEWIKIRVFSDLYECWINKKQHSPITEKTYQAINKNNFSYNGDLVQVVKNKNTKLNMPITLGASLPLIIDHQIKFDDYDFSFEGTIINGNKKPISNEIIQTAYLFLGAPYLWGGKSPFGIDCSGFTQIVYRLNGLQLPRDASQQVNLGSALSFVEESEAGDLAFFDNEEGNIVHVGILLDNQSIIHASGQVRIDKFDHYGIFHSENKKYSHHLRVIKRVI